jgi:mitogen-activated protein kinase 1/3
MPTLLPCGPSKGTWEIPDRYTVGSVIGSGSYGTVCEAEDKENERKVAIKRMKHLFDDLVDCKRILREIAILSQLEHPNIVRLYDIVQPSSMRSFDELYIVMELCDLDLKKLIKQDITLEQEQIDTLLYNLLVGVKYLHSAGIYHRDLKPANCLVNADCTVKVCDFGLSRPSPVSDVSARRQEPLPDTPREEGEAAPSVGRQVLVPHTARAKRVMTRHVVTRWYRAPELILLQDDYTESIDVWSVGCIYAELLQTLEGPSHMDRGPLFPGSSCFPLSPDRKHRHDRLFHTRGSTDQLNVIFEILGTPCEEDISQLKRTDAREHIRSCPQRKGSGLGKRLPWAAKQSLDLLARMLVFAPKKRVDVSGALEHSLLASIRRADTETTCPHRVTLEFDTLGDLSEGQLRKFIGHEVGKFHTEERPSSCGIS